MKSHPDMQGSHIQTVGYVMLKTLVFSALFHGGALWAEGRTTVDKDYGKDVFFLAPPGEREQLLGRMDIYASKAEPDGAKIELLNINRYGACSLHIPPRAGANVFKKAPDGTLERIGSPARLVDTYDRIVAAGCADRAERGEINIRWDDGKWQAYKETGFNYSDDYKRLLELNRADKKQSVR
ncbi:hypothetical protein PCA31118_05389 [Pandoraea captiosa]|uniref:Uncharacterized protein n=1 Tax=Pandoraea captiosa TaxID=2508302 RepID=A0A5E5AXR1_9BURK|nr:hypothetical protein [Pandoraea captiosa]VVE77093.1 hypothetical protein PCA31118_05389 [Pandoraea captiosa]